MPYYVIVSGLPKTVKKQKMVHFLGQFVFKRPPVKFWIESLSTAPDSSNQMVIRFESPNAAEKAVATLQDYPFQHTDQQIYLLKCYMKDEQAIPQENNDYEEKRQWPVEHQRAYSPVRSRSPHINEELSKIELEIELTNRKRMLVEAEQKLIMEQKRLEMLQNAGPSTVISEESEVAIKIKKQPTLKKERKRPQDQNNKAGENRGCKLYWPCRIIGKEMNNIIRIHIAQETRPIFNALLRTHVKQRILNVLQGMVVFNTKRIIAMYRQVYPMYTDEKFVLTLRDMIRQGQLPDELLQQSKQIGQQYTDSVNSDMTSSQVSSSNVDPLDLPIHELSHDLDDWTEDCDVK
ncbi:uncharacterized protein LOC119835978 isoform X1 [Zerene cesonia]|uniref:uncharacterized protein LOC119835978 isoform X1 n=1 Tax=Zerene cesonia TaxID=33412 RepID=UPI0018E5883F|nr:uncharacterized protein LOC119835978 isoform X1 [Zerene cesonia]